MFNDGLGRWPARAPYDWTWNTGPALFRLTYDRNNKIFEHNFEIIRERPK
jgi:hypothetical protein